MRRLTAYRERLINTPGTSPFGRLTIVEKYRVSSTSSSLVLAFRFQYNYTKHAVVLSKKDGSTLSATDLTSLGVATDEVVINVEMKKFKVGTSIIWYLEQSIAPFVAGALGLQIISRTFDGSTTTTILQADTSNTAKVFTNIANINATYINSVTVSSFNYPITVQTSEKYNSFDLELDDKTAIGITYQGFNPEKPDEIGFKYSNSFNIPNTATNARLTGYNAISDDVYDPWFVNYIVDNEKVISNGKIKVTDVDKDRISCTITAKSVLWDRLKEMSWPDFMALYYTLSGSGVAEGTWNGFLEKLYLRAYYGDLFGDSELPLIARDAERKSSALNDIVFKINGYSGGQIISLCSTIFNIISIVFGIDFTKGNNSVFLTTNIYIQNRYLQIRNSGSSAIPFFNVVYTRGFSGGSTSGLKMDKGKKTVYDFVKEFIIHTGCLVDVISDTEVALQRMDDIMLAPVIDFSGNIEKDSIKFSPAIDGVAQNNFIDFANYSAKIPKGSLQLNLQSLNRNLETSSTFLTLNEFAPPAYLDRDKSVLGLFEDASWENFTFLEDSGNTASYNLLGYIDLETELSYTKTIPIAKIANIGYSMWSSMIQKPVKYTIRKWLTNADIPNLKLFQRYWIDELQGYYMLNKISGLNPEKSNAATEMEFIKLPSYHTYEQILTVNKSSITLNPTGSIEAVAITSNTFWIIEESLSWVTVSKTSGSLNDTFNITIASNTTNAARSGNVLVKSQDGTVVRTIAISQSAIAISPTIIAFSELQTVINLVLTTTGSWTAEKSGDWFTISKTSGTGNDTIVVTKTAPYIADGSITITNGTVQKIITVTYS